MPRSARFDHAEIAGLVAAARNLDMPAIPHVALVLGVDRDTARGAISSARRAGALLPAHTVPKRRRAPVPGLALRCGDCPRSYPICGLFDLMTHVRREHDRTVTNEEKTPR